MDALINGKPKTTPQAFKVLPSRAASKEKTEKKNSLVDKVKEERKIAKAASTVEARISVEETDFPKTEGVDHENLKMRKAPVSQYRDRQNGEFSGLVFEKDTGKTGSSFLKYLRGFEEGFKEANKIDIKTTVLTLTYGDLKRRSTIVDPYRELWNSRPLNYWPSHTLGEWVDTVILDPAERVLDTKKIGRPINRWKEDDILKIEVTNERHFVVRMKANPTQHGNQVVQKIKSYTFWLTNEEVKNNGAQKVLDLIYTFTSL